ncbi:MAG: hypothetical protein ACREA0_31410, partial [bacterium]
MPGIALAVRRLSRLVEAGPYHHDRREASRRGFAVLASRSLQGMQYVALIDEFLDGTAPTRVAQLE